MDFQIFGSDIKNGHDSLTRQLRDIILTRTKVAKNAVQKMMKILVTTPVVHDRDSQRGRGGSMARC